MWLRRIAQRFFDTQYWGNQFREQNPDYQPQFNVFQSPDFPHVFLGGEDDLQEAEQMAGQPMCKVVDCRDLPEIDQAAWDYPEFVTVQREFDAKVNDLIQKISTTDCPIFVHCALGANRSVAVLASALTQLTGKPVNQVLSDMKQVRAFVGPQDPYYLMALQQSPSETPQHKQQVFDELDQDTPLIQPGLPTNTAQIPDDFPDDLLGDMNLLHEEKQWRRAVSTPGSLVTHNDYGWTGKVIELRGDPVNDGRVLVEYPLSAQEAEHLGADEGYVVQRFHRPLDLSPTMQLASPFRRASSWLQKIASSEDMLRSLVPQFIAAAQEEYNQWDQSDQEFGDPEVGFGGICQEIAGRIADIINMQGQFDAQTISASCGEQHVWVYVKAPEGIYEVDIPPCVYETGGGYNWNKIPGVEFGACDVVIGLVDVDPNMWNELE